MTLTRLLSNAAALCSSRERKHELHLLLLKIFGVNFRHSTRVPIISNYDFSFLGFVDTRSSLFFSFLLLLLLFLPFCSYYY